MAARQASQSNAMLYALITFIAMFIIATVFAVVYYVKSEEYRSQADAVRDDLGSIATSSEQREIAKIVGKPIDDNSYLGTMQKVVDDLYTFILGQQPPENLSATVKFNAIAMEINSFNKEILDEDINPAIGPNGVGLLKTIKELKSKLNNARGEIVNLEQINDDMQIDLEDATGREELNKQDFLAELDQFQAEVDQIRKSFDDLKQKMDTSTEVQIAAYQEQVGDIQSRLNQKQSELKDTQEKLKVSDEERQEAQKILEGIKPNPNKEVLAYRSDAQIVRIDLQAGIVYLDAGLKDRVYRGLTFAIYDRNKPIPESGEGKAEIEVFEVRDQVCAAQIIKSDTNNPVVPDDIVANLIWDRNKPNRFVVIGDFDFNNDGRIDRNGDQRIIELIERWGGRLDEKVSVDTDFLVVGVEPVALRRPTQDEIDIDPLAQQRYEKSVQKAKAYNQVLEKASDLGIPVFNQKRFLYLIGYETLASKNPSL